VRTIVLLVLLVVAGLVVLGLIAYKMWGIWALVGLIVFLVVLPFALKLLGGWLLKQLFMIPFKAKGRVLSGAKATVNSVKPAEAPARTWSEADPDQEDPDQEVRLPRLLDWYWIDVTITPRPTTGPFQFWEAGELLLVPPHVKSGTIDDGDEGSGELAELQVWQNGAFGPDEGYKYPGEQRLNLLVGIPQGQRKCRFRYYFEIFGEVDLPTRAA
jgi:hypothetical protein